MTLAQRRALGARRLAALGLSAPLPDRTPAGIVRSLGAMQAQDLPGALWSIGVRTGSAATAAAAVVEASARGEIVRTWPMRGTLHWVPGRDAAWMCALLAGPSMRAATRVHASLGITPATLATAHAAVDAALAGGRRLGRVPLLHLLTEAGIDIGGQRGYHLLVRLAQTGLIAQSVVATAAGGHEPVFGLLAELVPAPADPGPEEALSLLVERFVRSHGPVTERDLARWCDQPLRAVRAGIAGSDGRVRGETVDGTAYLVHEQAPAPPTSAARVFLLPGFDEWLLGYGDRSAQLTREQERSVVPGGNGVFRGTVVAGSIVVGRWRRRPGGRAGGPLVLDVDPFGPVSARLRAAVAEAGAAYGDFCGREVTVSWA